MSNSGALARPRRADPITGVSPSLNACSMTLTVRTRAWPGRARGKRHRAGHWELARVHGLTGWKEARRLDLGQQCSASVLEWRAGWRQQAAAPAIRDPLLSNLQFPFSHSPPQTPPATTTTAPFAPSRHADTARADLSQHRRRPVTRFPLPSIAHRPRGLRRHRLPIPGSKASKGRSSRSPGTSQQIVPRRAAEKSSPQDSSIHAETRISCLARSFNNCRSSRFPSSHLYCPPRPASTCKEHAPGTRCLVTGAATALSAHPPSALRPPPSTLHLGHPPISICHLPSAIAPPWSRGVAGSQTDRETFLALLLLSAGRACNRRVTHRGVHRLVVEVESASCTFFFPSCLVPLSMVTSDCTPTPHMPLPCSQLRCLPALDDIIPIPI